MQTSTAVPFTSHPVLRPSTHPASTVSDYIALLKPGVMSLVVFSGFTGMMLAPGTIHPFLALLTICCIAMGSGAGGAINMWYDRDIDTVMLRTVSRPIPAGRIHPDNALAFGMMLAVTSVSLMGLATNWVAAFLLAGAIAFYIVIYTMWLKRRTPQNIVIGGAAGAFPPMIGWAAVTGSISLESLLLFTIIFLWTPPHFWALAVYRNDDYRRANVPMLPVVAGIRATKRQILLYSYLLVAITLLPQPLHMLGSLYSVGAALLGGGFIALAHRVWRTDADRPAKQLFGYSICYLFVLFSLMLADHAWEHFITGV